MESTLLSENTVRASIIKPTQQATRLAMSSKADLEERERRRENGAGDTWSARL
jgi:hypothetical protein